MSSNTEKFGLLKKDPSTDGTDTFNIKTMMNENWDKIDKLAVKEPFLLKSAVYDSVNNKIDATLGAGIADFLQTIITKTADTVYSIPTPAINTSYYIYLKSDGTFTHNTTGAEVDGAVKLLIVSTGSTVDAVTTTDQRGKVGGSAQVVKDLLDTHESANDPHPQYKLDTDAPNAHKATHATGGEDAITPADIGASPSGHGHATATTTVDGFMASTDKSKLNGIEAGATADQTAGEILDAVKTVDGAGSGLDTDFFRGLALATAATANTVMQRDANGYARAVIFHQTYGSLNANIGNIMTQISSTDGFLRPSTPAQVAAAIEPHLGGAKSVSGSYTGDGAANRVISVGFTPKYVLVFSANYSRIAEDFTGSGGLGNFRDWKTATGSTTVTTYHYADHWQGITTNGFKLGTSTNGGNFNTSAYAYQWIAIS
jgi:hypothetical protein